MAQSSDPGIGDALTGDPAQSAPGKRRRRRAKVLAGTVGLPILVFVAVVLVRRETGNFGTLINGQVFRSGQMRAGQLGRTIRSYGIKTVLNLRGVNPKEAWYRDERAATLAEGATQVDVPMASDQWMARDQMRVIVEILDTCKTPLLIHCEWGAERTGLVSAFQELLRPGGTLENARNQFSAKYLYLPMRDGLMMRGHLDRYAAWLAGEGTTHSPAAFRRWVKAGYEPGSPCREEWPYNPYPLVVVTRPHGTSAGPSTAQQPPRDAARR